MSKLRIVTLVIKNYAFIRSVKDIISCIEDVVGGRENICLLHKVKNISQKSLIFSGEKRIFDFLTTQTAQS